MSGHMKWEDYKAQRAAKETRQTNEGTSVNHTMNGRITFENAEVFDHLREELLRVPMHAQISGISQNDNGSVTINWTWSKDH